MEAFLRRAIKRAKRLLETLNKNEETKRDFLRRAIFDAEKICTDLQDPRRDRTTIRTRFTDAAIMFGEGGVLDYDDNE